MSRLLLLLLFLPLAAFAQYSGPALETCRAGIRDLKMLTRPTASEMALARYDDAVGVLSDASARASVIRNAHPDSAMRDLAESCEQELEKLSTEIALDRGVYEVLERLNV